MMIGKIRKKNYILFAIAIFAVCSLLVIFSGRKQPAEEMEKDVFEDIELSDETEARIQKAKEHIVA